ncbi:hypothetical protein [Paenibacillus sp. RC253]
MSDDPSRIFYPPLAAFPVQYESAPKAVSGRLSILMPLGAAG